MKRMSYGLLKNLGTVVLDTLFPASERTQRVMAEKERPLPASLKVREYHGRTITVLASYDEPRVRDAICALKFERDRHSCTLLAALLDDFLTEHSADAALFGERVVCSPIPLGAKRLKERGVNQVEEILKETRAVRSGLLPLVHALERVRETKMQSTLPRAERLINVRGAFSTTPAAHALHGTTVLLIDDVTTTGATLHEAASVLERMGVRVMALALAG